MNQGNERLTDAARKLSRLYPVLENIPEAVKIKDQKHQNRILINGELREWRGSVHHVFSPVLINRNGTFERLQIGSYPLATVEEATETLHAAVAAYNGGRGERAAIHIMRRFNNL